MHDVLGAVADRAASAAGSRRALEDPIVDVDCAKLARQLRHSARTIIGLLPASASVRVQPLALELAFALAIITEKLTLILDPEQDSLSTTSRDLGQPPEGELLVAHVPANLVVTLVPTLKAPAGAKFEMVRVMLQLALREPDTFGHALVDLSGCRFPGELLGATALLEGIIVVGQAGKSSETDLLSTVKLVPTDLQLGVVLTD
jgi:hypothetical protein